MTRDGEPYGRDSRFRLKRRWRRAQVDGQCPVTSNIQHRGSRLSRQSRRLWPLESPCSHLVPWPAKARVWSFVHVAILACADDTPSVSQTCSSHFMRMLGDNRPAKDASIHRRRASRVLRHTGPRCTLTSRARDQGAVPVRPSEATLIKSLESLNMATRDTQSLLRVGSPSAAASSGSQARRSELIPRLPACCHRHAARTTSRGPEVNEIEGLLLDSGVWSTQWSSLIAVAICRRRRPGPSSSMPPGPERYPGLNLQVAQPRGTSP